MQFGSVVGNILGYCEGSFLYYLGGYQFPFIVNSGLLLIIIILSILYVPSEKKIYNFIIEN